MTTPNPFSAHPESASRLEQLEALIVRDRNRKLLVALPTAALIGTAVALQSIWVLAIAATGLLGLQAIHRQR